MEVKNNPAGRIHDILVAARDHPDDMRAKKVWAAVFGVDEKDIGTLLEMHADLISTLAEAKAAIAREDDLDHELHLQPFKELEALLAETHLDVPWRSVKGRLNDKLLLGLRHSADRLARSSQFKQIKSDALESLRKEVEDLISAVLNAEIPQGVKAELLEHLERFRHAVVAYRIRGVEGLSAEVKHGVGVFVIEGDRLKNAPEKERSLWKRYGDIVQHANDVVTFARNAKELAVPALALLSNWLKGG